MEFTRMFERYLQDSRIYYSVQSTAASDVVPVDTSRSPRRPFPWPVGNEFLNGNPPSSSYFQSTNLVINTLPSLKLNNGNTKNTTNESRTGFDESGESSWRISSKSSPSLQDKDSILNIPSQGGNHDSNDTIPSTSTSADKTPTTSRKPPEVRFICATCSAGFMRKEHLLRHERVHSGAKPFQCPLCHKSFSRADNRNSHLLTHDRAKGKPSRSANRNRTDKF